MRVGSPSRAVPSGGGEHAVNTRLFMRLLAWGAGTAVALAIAVAAGRTELGAKRAHAALTAMLSGPAPVEPQISERLTAWSNGVEAEMRRQAETIRAFAGERDGLAEKVAAVDRQLGDLGDTLARTSARLEVEAKAAQQAAASAMAAAVARAPQRPDAVEATAPPAPSPPAPAASTRATASREAARPSVPPSPPNPAPAGQIHPTTAVPTSALGFPMMRPDGLPPATAYTGTVPMPAAPESATAMIGPFSVATPLSSPAVAPAAAEPPIGPPVPLPRPFPSKAQPMAAPAAPAAPTPAAPVRGPSPVNAPMTTGIFNAPVEPGAISTEFAIDLGATATIDAARTRWNELRASQSPLFDNLKPAVALKEGGKSGPELHLVAGPLTSSATSARLCAVLAGTGTPCQPTAFDGQRLNAR
jgi:hypothetical protein